MSGASLVRLNRDPNFPDAGSWMTVLGFGDTDPSESRLNLSDRLRRVEVSVISNSDCEDSSGYNGNVLEVSFLDFILANFGLLAGGYHRL